MSLITNTKTIRKAIEDYGTDSIVFQPWATIDKESKLSEHYLRLVSATDVNGDTKSTYWIGDKPLETYRNRIKR